MKGLKFIALMMMIWGIAVFVKFAPVRPIFEEKPTAALVIALVASLFYKMADTDF